MERAYKCLTHQNFKSGDYSIVPIRDRDKHLIMKWRNEQIDILRQKEPLTIESQELYFKNVVSQLFENEKPNQLLFSFLERDILIGYGGLVHIDWESANAEISFLTATDRHTNDDIFVADFKNYLNIILVVAFEDLRLSKVYTTVYDIKSRKSYIKTIESSDFIKEATLKNHIMIHDTLENVMIYSRFNNRQ